VEDLRIDARLVIPGSELSESFSRASGPGGQHVNKVETAVELRWSVLHSEALSERDRQWLLSRLAAKLTNDGDLIVTAGGTRSQARNREDARERMAALVLAALVRPKPRKKTRPSRGAQQRRIEKKKARGATKRARQKPGDDGG
jgi:ribosome-associated protein